MARIHKNFAAAVTATTISAYTPLELDIDAGRPGGEQFARFFAKGDLTSGTTAATLRLALVRDGVPIWYDDATISVSAVVAGSGELVGNVSFAKSSSDKVDLLGCKPASGGGTNMSYKSSLDRGAAVWMFAVTSLGSFDDLDIYVETSPVI